MVVSRLCHVALVCLLCASAGGTPANGQSDAAAITSWASRVREKVVAVVATVVTKRLPPTRVPLSFTVGATGEISGVAAEGSSEAGTRAMAALRALGRVPAPPDRRAHRMNVVFSVK